jgi:hypothetical protein
MTLYLKIQQLLLPLSYSSRCSNQANTLTNKQKQQIITNVILWLSSNRVSGILLQIPSQTLTPSSRDWNETNSHHDRWSSAVHVIRRTRRKINGTLRRRVLAATRDFEREKCIPTFFILFYFVSFCFILFYLFLKYNLIFFMGFFNSLKGPQVLTDCTLVLLL